MRIYMRIFILFSLYIYFVTLCTYINKYSNMNMFAVHKVCSQSQKVCDTLCTS